MRSGVVSQKLMKFFLPVFLFSSSCADSFPKGGYKTFGFGIDFRPQRCDLSVFKTVNGGISSVFKSSGMPWGAKTLSSLGITTAAEVEKFYKT